MVNTGYVPTLAISVNVDGQTMFMDLAQAESGHGKYLIFRSTRMLSHGCLYQNRMRKGDSDGRSD